jgi:hypothetical protein
MSIPINPNDWWVVAPTVYKFTANGTCQRIPLKCHYNFKDFCKMTFGTTELYILDMPDNLKLVMTEESLVSNKISINQGFRKFYKDSQYRGELIMACVNDDKIQPYEFISTWFKADLCDDGHLFFYRKDDSQLNDLMKSIK